MPIFLFFLTTAFPLYAQEQENTCPISDRSCLLEEIIRSAESIDNVAWRDQTYREAAKTHAFEGNFEVGLSLIEKIKTPDTKAMTIRGIAMTLAAQDHTKTDLDEMFSSLRRESEKITHPPSYAIALTYIAMAQAFAGDNEGAWQTASEMENDALRYKAYGETAEIQAERGNFKAAKISIEKIESLAFRNKAYGIVAEILASAGLYEDAYKSARTISNPYKRTQAIQFILDAQKPREVIH